MRLLFTACLCVATTAWAVTDYSEITKFTGPCARELAVMAKEGDVKSARDQARALCRSETAKTCPDLWLVYAYCEIKLMESDALAVSAEAVRRSPNSAAAQLLNAMAIVVDGSSGGMLRMIRMLGPLRQAMERAVLLDPDCHPARSFLVQLYAAPKLLGGDTTKHKYHLAELDRRDPYYSAITHGKMEADRKNFTAAEPFFREAQRLNPEASEPKRKLIQLSAAEGKYEEAFEICSSLKPKHSADVTMEELFIELSVQSGLRTEEALAASNRYMATARRVLPLQRAEVMVNTAVLLNRLGRREESAKLVAKAEAQWAGAKRLFNQTEKEYRNKGLVVAKQ